MFAQEGKCKRLLSVFCILNQFILYWCQHLKLYFKNLSYNLLLPFPFQPSEVNIKITDKIRYSCYMIHVLVPLLKELCREQMMEKEIEAKIQGLLSSEIKLKQACFSASEGICCKNCGASIVDLHRSCNACSYALCLSCCQELRDLHLPGGERMKSLQYKAIGKGYVHAGLSADKPRPLTEWRANSNGSLTCPSKELGGCGSSLLDLKHIFSENRLSELEEKAEALLQTYNFVKLPDMSARCFCFNPSNRVDYEREKLRKAACREESDDNFIYCPNAEEIEQDELEHFQQHWFKGQPVIIRNVLNFTLGLSWEPEVILRALRERSKIKDESDLFEVKAINCLNWSHVGMHIYRFFRGYTKGWIEKSRRPKMLKLKDWPPASYFGERLYCHCNELIGSLPYQEYTNPRTGFLNLALKLPENVRKPDLGPRLHVAYGLNKEIGRGDSVTLLHFDQTDTVNVLTHMTEVNLFFDWNSKELKKRHGYQDNKEDISTNLKMDEKYSAPPASNYTVLDNIDLNNTNDGNVLSFKPFSPEDILDEQTGNAVPTYNGCSLGKLELTTRDQKYLNSYVSNFNVEAGEHGGPYKQNIGVKFFSADGTRDYANLDELVNEKEQENNFCNFNDRQLSQNEDIEKTCKTQDYQNIAHEIHTESSADNPLSLMAAFQVQTQVDCVICEEDGRSTSCNVSNQLMANREEQDKMGLSQEERMHGYVAHGDFDVDGIHTKGPSTVKSTSVFDDNQSRASSNELLISDCFVEKTVQWNVSDMVSIRNETCKERCNQDIDMTSETGDIVGETIEHSGDVHLFVVDSERNEELCWTDVSSVSMLTKIDVENAVSGVHNSGSGLYTYIKDKSNERDREISTVEEQNNDGDMHLRVKGTENNGKLCCLGIDQNGRDGLSCITADNNGTSDVRVENSKGKFEEKKKICQGGYTGRPPGFTKKLGKVINGAVSSKLHKPCIADSVSIKTEYDQETVMTGFYKNNSVISADTLMRGEIGEVGLAKENSNRKVQISVETERNVETCCTGEFLIQQGATKETGVADSGHEVQKEGSNGNTDNNAKRADEVGHSKEQGNSNMCLSVVKTERDGESYCSGMDLCDGACTVLPGIKTEDGEAHFVVTKDIEGKFMDKKKFLQPRKVMGNPPGFIKKLGKAVHDGDLRGLHNNEEADHFPDKYKRIGEVDQNEEQEANDSSLDRGTVVADDTVLVATQGAGSDFVGVTSEGKFGDDGVLQELQNSEEAYHYPDKCKSMVEFDQKEENKTNGSGFASCRVLTDDTVEVSRSREVTDDVVEVSMQRVGPDITGLTPEGNFGNGVARELQNKEEADQFPDKPKNIGDWREGQEVIDSSLASGRAPTDDTVEIARGRDVTDDTIECAMRRIGPDFTGRMPEGDFFGDDVVRELRNNEKADHYPGKPKSVGEVDWNVGLEANDSSIASRSGLTDDTVEIASGRAIIDDTIEFAMQGAGPDFTGLMPDGNLGDDGVMRERQNNEEADHYPDQPKSVGEVDLDEEQETNDSSLASGRALTDDVVEVANQMFGAGFIGFTPEGEFRVNVGKQIIPCSNIPGDAVMHVKRMGKRARQKMRRRNPADLGLKMNRIVDSFHNETLSMEEIDRSEKQAMNDSSLSSARALAGDTVEVAKQRVEANYFRMVSEGNFGVNVDKKIVLCSDIPEDTVMHSKRKRSRCWKEEQGRNPAGLGTKMKGKPNSFPIEAESLREVDRNEEQEGNDASLRCGRALIDVTVEVAKQGFGSDFTRHVPERNFEDNVGKQTILSYIPEDAAVPIKRKRSGGRKKRQGRYLAGLGIIMKRKPDLYSSETVKLLDGKIPQEKSDFCITGTRTVANELIDFERHIQGTGISGFSLKEGPEKQTHECSGSPECSGIRVGKKIIGSQKKKSRKKSKLSGGRLRGKPDFVPLGIESNGDVGGDKAQDVAGPSLLSIGSVTNESLHVNQNGSAGESHLPQNGCFNMPGNFEYGVEKTYAGGSKRKSDGKPTNSGDNRQPEQSEGAAVWDVFRREDVMKLQEYLKRHSAELRGLHCSPVEQLVHPIHDQAFYLTSEHKTKLKKEFGVEPWTFEQKLGEAVFVPAGCPHQVRNLKSCMKVALDFMSPESVHECIRLTDEYRAPHRHAWGQKLEVKKMVVYAINQIVKDLEDRKSIFMLERE
ncbi:uncharacterized protein LOC103717076 isoform X1 [Phoenix dactylifera]|uniref:Uncharacterized protein LOC103717076 isoform X1 n=1 Tax=Phoenix dactylifera TaxID=42345 RepID=A0A8B8ZVI9_PHODC|nr:uncharacterized protein LOC103717076 isoform X1 [Phoenix dactylifera]